MHESAIRSAQGAFRGPERVASQNPVAKTQSNVKSGTTAPGRHTRTMPEPIDFLYYTNQARKCRRLAKHADSDTARKLVALAEEYEARANGLEQDS